METKICACCKQEKPIDQFKRSYCLICKKEVDKKQNPTRRKWNDENKELAKKYYQKYYSNPDVRKRNNDYSKINNTIYKKKRRDKDPLFKLISSARSLISQSFRNKNYTKPYKTNQILGCTFEELKQHLELQFEPWMNWDNRGSNSIKEQNVSWDIDHIIPLSTAKIEEDIIKLNHYTNLRPVCSYYNRYIKRDKIELA
jgi:hypothetical protein